MLKLRTGSGLKDRLFHPIDEYWDRRLNVSTFGYHPAIGQPGDGDFQVHYTPTPYAVCFRMLRHVGLTSTDTVADLGCGLGRMVFAASWLGAKRAVGVEIVPQLSRQAQENLDRSRLRDRDIQFVCTPAEKHSLADTTVLLMFHPFGAGTMRAVVRRLENDLKQGHRDLRIAYLNPVHAAELDASAFLSRLDDWPGRPNALSRNSRYAVTFWQSKKT